MATKADLIKKMAVDAGITQAQATAALQALEVGIIEALAQDQAVTLKGFASFTPKAKAARTGRNPKTGEALVIPAKKTVLFKLAKTTSDAIQ
ncbi:MAG: hypothetical protein RLY58_2347 [Pseudomonadota bacterium]|jgi:nucleoid DNA-binding protein